MKRIFWTGKCKASLIIFSLNLNDASLTHANNPYKIFIKIRI